MNPVTQNIVVTLGGLVYVDDQAVKTMTRTGDRRELLKGPLYFF